jgi:sigma-B regulation protein RsbU (phosphoserine phosphatase)
MDEALERLADCRILVVEDDVAIQQLLIGHYLEELGITNVTYAEDGVAGLETAARIMPDLIILDIEMPRMNGLEMLKRLRGDPTLKHIPVIIETAEESSERREQMFELGATDFVLKPLNTKEFHGRVRVHLENLLHLRRLQDDLTRIDQELQDAAALQRALLPAEEKVEKLGERYGLAISSVFEPSSRLGGDFWGIMPVSDTAIGVFICDFAGHGVSAAMNTFQLHTMLDRLPPLDPHNPAAFVSGVNQGLNKVLKHRHYATLLFAIIDLAANKLRYSAAASPNPLVGQRGSVELRTLNGSGMPLGLLASAPYDNREVDFPPGSFVFMYSDALSEAAVSKGRLMGEEGIKALVRETVTTTPQQAPLDHIVGAIPRRPGATLADDLTAVWIERL